MLSGSFVPVRTALCTLCPEDFFPFRTGWAPQDTSSLCAMTGLQEVFAPFPAAFLFPLSIKKPPPPPPIAPLKKNNIICNIHTHTHTLSLILSLNPTPVPLSFTPWCHCHHPLLSSFPSSVIILLLWYHPPPPHPLCDFIILLLTSSPLLCRCHHPTPKATAFCFDKVLYLKYQTSLPHLLGVGHPVFLLRFCKLSTSTRSIHEALHIHVYKHFLKLRWHKKLGIMWSTIKGLSEQRIAVKQSTRIIVIYVINTKEREHKYQ